MGITFAGFEMPLLIDLNSTLKNKYNYDEISAHDISSSIYVFCNHLSESFGPFMGGYLTEMVDFEFSCLVFGLLSFAYFLVFFFVYRTEILERIKILKEDSFKKVDQAQTQGLNEKFLEKDDFSKPQKITENNLAETLKNRKKIKVAERKTRTTTSLLYMLDVSTKLDFEIK